MRCPIRNCQNSCLLDGLLVCSNHWGTLSQKSRERVRVALLDFANPDCGSNNMHALIMARLDALKEIERATGDQHP